MQYKDGLCVTVRNKILVNQSDNSIQIMRIDSIGILRPLYFRQAGGSFRGSGREKQNLEQKSALSSTDRVQINCVFEEHKQI
jgi:hypothetical protein